MVHFSIAMLVYRNVCSSSSPQKQNIGRLSEKPWSLPKEWVIRHSSLRRYVQIFRAHTQHQTPLPVISRVITPFVGAITPCTHSFVRPFMGILQSIHNNRLGAHFASPREFATTPDTILLTPFAVERRLGFSHVRYFDRSSLAQPVF